MCGKDPEELSDKTEKSWVLRQGGFVSRVHSTRFRKCAHTIEEKVIDEKNLEKQKSLRNTHLTEERSVCS